MLPCLGCEDVGSSTKNVLPFPLPSDVAQILPLCISTNCLAIYNPSPAPSIENFAPACPREKLSKE